MQLTKTDFVFLAFFYNLLCIFKNSASFSKKILRDTIHMSLWLCSQTPGFVPIVTWGPWSRIGASEALSELNSGYGVGTGGTNAMRGTRVGPARLLDCHRRPAACSSARPQRPRRRSATELRRCGVWPFELLMRCVSQYMFVFCFVVLQLIQILVRTGSN